jgi:WD40 repeat protein
MSRIIRCPKCDEPIEFSRRRRGPTIRCPECRAQFDPFADDDGPDRRSRREDNDERRPAFPMTAVIVGGVFAGLILFSALIYFASRPTKPADAADMRPRAERANSDADPQWQADVPAGQENLPKQNKRPTPIVPPVIDQSPKVSKPPAVPADPDAKPLVVAWRAAADPAKNEWNLPAKFEKISIKMGAYDAAYFPSSPSPFFAVGATVQSNGAVVLYDARTAKPVGRVPGKTDLYPPIRLSPGGKYLAGKMFLGAGVDVFDFATGQGARRLEFNNTPIVWLDFGPEDATVLVGLSDSQGSRIQVWDVAAGQLLRTIPLDRDFHVTLTAAMSPGRHLLAVASKERINLYRVDDGKLVGTAPFPDIAKNRAMIGAVTCTGLAFSADGAELAGLFKNSGVDSPHLTGWKMATGATAFDYDVAVDNRLKSSGAPDELQFGPDGQSLLVYNDLIIERDSGNALTKLHGERGPGRSALRWFANDMILGEDHSARAIVSAPFNRAAYAAAVKAARADVANVTCVAADRSALKIIPVAANPKWEAAPDAAPASGKLFPSVTLASGGLNVRAALFSSPEAGQAATVSVVELTTPFVRKVLRWDRYNLATGKHLGSVDLGKCNEPKKHWPGVVAALSPNGALLALVAEDDSKRIDIWSAETKERVAFLPSSKGGAVGWIGFAAEQKLLTMVDGALTLWEVPACKAVYEIGLGYEGMAAFSPNRRWLAAFRQNGFDLLNPVTGQCVGNMALTSSNTSANATAAFSLDGKKLAGIVANGAQHDVRTCDVATGVMADVFPVAAIDGHFQWCGPNLLLHGSTLIDTESKLAVWRYDGSLANAIGAADGRFWYARGTTQGVLGAVTLPDPTAAKMLALFRNPMSRALLGPKAPIAIQVNVAGPGGDPEFAKELTRRVGQFLEGRGFVVGDAGAAVRLTVNAAVENTDQVYEIRSIGGKPVAPRKVPMKRLVFNETLTDSGGRVVWKDQRQFGQSGATRIFNGDEEPEKVMEKELWNSALTQVANPQLPARAYLIDGNVFIPPGVSRLP